MKKIIVVVLIAFAAFFGYFLHRVWVKGHTIVYDGPCAFESWDKNSEHIFLNLNCDGKRAVTTNTKIILAYLQNPGVLTCKVNTYDLATCIRKD